MAKIGNMWFRTGTSSWVAKVDSKCVTLANGKENEDLAKVEYAKLVVKLNAESEENNGISDKTTVKTIFGLYVDHFSKLHPDKTIIKKPRYRDMFLARFGTTTVKDLKSHQIQDWIEEQTTWAGSTRLWVLRMMNHVFAWALRREYITRNPIVAVEKPKDNVRGEDVVISDENFAKLRTAAAPYMKRIMDALWYTGARPDEILSAHAAEYNKEAGVLDKSKHKTKAKGVKRKIALPPNIVKLVEEQLAVDPEGYLFAGKAGRPLSSKDFYNRLQELKLKVGIEATVIPYGFRHTYATKLILDGVPDVHVATLLGHTSTKHLHRNYSHALAMAKGMSTSLDRVVQVMGKWQEKASNVLAPVDDVVSARTPAA